ncbi:hypothetical protein ES703_78734 [subsurface metagenome]
MGYSGDDVARRLRISGRGVSDCRERGKKIPCAVKPHVTLQEQGKDLYSWSELMKCESYENFHWY